MSISMFLKNWRNKLLLQQKYQRKQLLLKQIYQLKEEAARLKSSAQVAKRSANETSSYVTLRQKEALYGDWPSSVYLSCYLDNHLEKLHHYEKNYAIFNQRYLNTLDKIKRLEEELENL